MFKTMLEQLVGLTKALIPLHTARYMSALRLAKSQREMLAKNCSFKNLYKGKRAFVIGNGPSLKKQNLDLLENELIFAVNSFWRHPLMEKREPTVLTVADPALFDGRKHVAVDEYLEIMSKTIPNCPIFAPLWGKGAIDNKPDFIHRERFYYLATFGDISRYGEYPIDLTKPMLPCESVTIWALAIAIYCGCHPIYLVGMDHDWLANRHVNEHFYQQTKEIDRLEGSNSFERYSYERLMSSILRLFQSYRYLKSTAVASGSEIFNATDGGFLDVFKRVDYRTLF